MFLYMKFFVLFITINHIKCLPTFRKDEWDNEEQPIDYKLENPVSPFIGRSSELDEISLLLKDKEKYLVITGLRGVGKTELVRKYAEQYKKSYTSSVVWIKSDSVTEMVDEFKNLAGEIGLPREGKKITQIVREVFHFFKSRTVLFIFDNASSDNILLKYLRDLIIDETNTNIIITSRNEDWDQKNFKSLYLHSFTNREAVKYIKIALKDVNIPTDETECEELANALLNLPLALNKSTEYIIKQNIEKRFTIDDFIKLMDKADTTTPDPVVYKPIDYHIEKDIIQKIADETDKVGDKIVSGASHAWEKVSDGAVQAGKEISKAAKSFGGDVKKFFSGFG